jgi:hypothetical protein
VLKDIVVVLYVSDIDSDYDSYDFYDSHDYALID